MKNKILAVAAVAMLVGLSAQAVLQYELIPSQPPGQGWPAAQQLLFKVTGGGSLWISSFVSNWYGTLQDLGSTADMTAGNYGWMTQDGTIHYSTGETKEITFTKEDGSKSISTNAYFVGNFNAGDEIGLWLTNTTDSKPDQLGYSLGKVGEGLNAELGSRQYNTTDIAGNTRINFGFLNGGDSVEFLLSPDTHYSGGGPVGQPLPGVFATLALAGGVGTALTRKNRKRE